MKAILAKTPSRIIWRLKVPPDAWLRTSLGIQPEAWTKEGDGVLFRIGVSFQNYEELLNLHVDPVAKESDRRWIPVNIDLTAYAGEEVEVISTRTRVFRRRATTAVTTSRSGCAGNLHSPGSQHNAVSHTLSRSLRIRLFRGSSGRDPIEYLPFIAKYTPLGSTWTTDNALPRLNNPSELPNA